MKKLVSIIMSISLIMGIASTSVFAESNYIDGLEEKMNALWISADDYPEVVENMKNQREAMIKGKVKEYTEMPEWMKQKIGYGGMTSEEIEKSVRTVSEELDYTKIIKIYPTVTPNYTLQYANENNVDYLIDDYYGFSVIDTKGNGWLSFTNNGELSGDRIKVGRVHGTSKIMLSRGLKILNNIEGINQLLVDKGEIHVNDIKIIASGSAVTFLYINCDGRKYFIELSGLKKDKDTPELYTYTEIVQGKYDVDYLLIKPTYSTEAESLQAEGLLKGNENGLDLLKPLTRIEAATMLLRAMGEDETADTSQIQTFSDVPSEHWGFGAAENAYNLGLVKGVGDDKFAPDESVTAEQFATMVLRAGEEPEFNWEEAINIMIDKGIISQENASTMDFFTRGDMAKIIYEARQNGLL